MTKETFRILVVDDEDMLCDLIGRVLSLSGFQQVTLVSDSREALDLLWREPFDLVISDYHMPEVTGDRIAAGALAAHPDSVVFILSGSLDPEHERALSRLGVSRCIHKPFSLDEFTEAVEEVFQGARSGAAPA